MKSKFSRLMMAARQILVISLVQFPREVQTRFALSLIERRGSCRRSPSCASRTSCGSALQ